MSNPINPSTEKIRQVFYPLSLKPSNDEEFPISYADNIWDVANIGSTLAALTGSTGQYDQHTLNELFAYTIAGLIQTLDLIWKQIGGDTPAQGDFSSDFSADFD